MQKADTRSDFDQLKTLREKLLAGKVVDEFLEKSLEKVWNGLAAWKGRVAETLEECEQQPVDVSLAKKVSQLISEGDEFNIKLPEVSRLNAVCVPRTVHAQGLSLGARPAALDCEGRPSRQLGVELSRVARPSTSRLHCEHFKRNRSSDPQSRLVRERPRAVHSQRHCNGHHRVRAGAL